MYVLSLLFENVDVMNEKKNILLLNGTDHVRRV